MQTIQIGIGTYALSGSTGLEDGRGTGAGRGGRGCRLLGGRPSVSRNNELGHRTLTAVTVTVVVFAGEPPGMAAARIAKVIMTAKLREKLENIVNREKAC